MTGSGCAKVIAGCREDDVAEIVSLGTTLAKWRPEILAYHDTGASNGPTEGLNLCVKKVKRCGHGFRRFEHYRIRVLLHTGGINWPARPRPPPDPVTPNPPLRRVEPSKDHVHLALEESRSPTKFSVAAMSSSGASHCTKCPMSGNTMGPT